MPNDPLSVAATKFEDEFNPIQKAKELKLEEIAEENRRGLAYSNMINKLKLPDKWDDPKYHELLNKYNRLRDLGVEYLNKGYDLLDYSKKNLEVTTKFQKALQQLKLDIQDYKNLGSVFNNALDLYTKDYVKGEGNRVFDDVSRQNLEKLRQSRSMDEYRQVISSDILVPREVLYSDSELQDRILKNLEDFTGSLKEDKSYRIINGNKVETTKSEMRSESQVREGISRLISTDPKLRKSIEKYKTDPNQTIDNWVYDNFGKQLVKKQFEKDVKGISGSKGGRENQNLNYSGKTKLTYKIHSKPGGKLITNEDDVEIWTINTKGQDRIYEGQIPYALDMDEGNFILPGKEGEPFIKDYEVKQIVKNPNYKWIRNTSGKKPIWKKDNKQQGNYVLATAKWEDEYGENLRDVLIPIEGGIESYLKNVVNVNLNKLDNKKEVIEVIRITKDGRKAIFDSVTKKFLKYLDE